MLPMLGNLGPAGLLLGKLLEPGSDWKDIVKTVGKEEAQRRIKAMAKAKLRNTINPKIVAAMQSEEWSWENAQKSEFLSKQKVDAAARLKGPGFVIMRDAMYAQLKELGIPGGLTRDTWRDAADDPAYEDVRHLITSDTPLAEIINIAGDALIEHIV